MAKFQTVEDVQKVFRMRANGSDQLEQHAGFRYDDIEKLRPVVEQLLDTDYNKISGFSFSEICEAISHMHTQFGSQTYAQDCRNHSVGVSEALYQGVDLSKCEDNFYSLSEAFDAVEYAKINGYTSIISCAGLETSDTTIADMAVALNTGLVKFGSLSRAEKVSKYNRLLEIEDELQETSLYKGLKAFYSIQ